MILTPDQRVRVFISSTLGELAAERAAARRAIARLHLVPVWYESGARPHPPRSMYRAYLAQSQVFVGIYWQRYGWVAPGMEISGLEDEFRLAAGKPMLLYLKRPAPDQEPRLAAMIDTIRAAGTVSYRTFATARELERLLADDLAVLLSGSFAGTALGTQASPTSSGEPGEADLPTGTVTFLFTDIEGSTRLWESVPDAMEVALEQHNRLLTEVIEGHGGVVVTSRGEGDSFFAVFPSAVAAVEAAGACQLALHAEPWPEGAALRVRMGLHTGEARARGSDRIDHGPINRCARLKAAAHGGQVLVTKTTRDLVGGRLGGGFALQRLGEFRLRDLAEPELIYQLTHPDLSADFPPLKTIHVGNIPLQATSFVGRAEAQGGLAELDGVLDVEPVEVGPPAQVQVRGHAGRPGPPQPQGLLRPRGPREVIDVDADHPAAHDGRLAPAGPAAAGCQLGVQPGPGGHRDRAVGAVAGGELHLRRAPGGGLLAVEPGAVTPGPASAARGAGWGVGIEHPVTLDPHQDLGILPAQLVG